MAYLAPVLWERIRRSIVMSQNENKQTRGEYSGVSNLWLCSHRPQVFKELIYSKHEDAVHGELTQFRSKQDIDDDS